MEDRSLELHLRWEKWVLGWKRERGAEESSYKGHVSMDAGNKVGDMYNEAQRNR